MIIWELSDIIHKAKYLIKRDKVKYEKICFISIANGYWWRTIICRIFNIA